jgi:hypothetical protein
MSALDLDFPNAPKEYERRFGGEIACSEHLRGKTRFDGFRCPHCGTESACFVAALCLDEYNWFEDRTLATPGTLSHGTRALPRTWFCKIFEFLAANHGCNANRFARTLDLAFETMWIWLRRIRDVFCPVRVPLCGDVEFDETHVGAGVGLLRRRCGHSSILVVFCTV